uniref:Uncharacterized protein n=1 Tax=Arundo donax TaxID=35708 RepID=A0A0A9C3H4_ARUDO
MRECKPKGTQALLLLHGK